ncbi:MAG: quinol dehydrogenase ferredoxin subunit NapH [Burkholderiaceae bacterium]
MASPRPAAPEAAAAAPSRARAGPHARARVPRALRRTRWLLARRLTQAAVLAAFVSGPWWGVPVAEGTLAASRWLGVLELSDPLVALQALLAGHVLAAAGLAGAALVALFYALLAGRLYCAWVCPINLVTDAVEALRRAFGLGRFALLRADRRLRHVVLVLALAASAATGSVAWEAINPITISLRALVFGAWSGGLVALATVAAIDLVVLRHGWCGHLCPVGAFYGWLGRFGRLSVHAVHAEACTRCGDCYAICPEPHVIAPVLRPGATAIAIADADCLRCGRCIDHCDEDVFALRLAASTPHRRG